MAIDVRQPPAAPPASEPPQRRTPSRVRPRTFTRVDLYVCAGSVVSAVALAWVVYSILAPFSGALGFVLLWFALFEIIYWLAVRDLEGPTAAKDRAIAAGMSCIAIGILVPLFSILAYVTWRGVQALSLLFFVRDLRYVGSLSKSTAGGGLHAIIGTLEQVGIATVISVPLGVLTAIFLNEVGGPLSRPVRIMVDAMSGVPSVVAGLFIYAMLVSKFGFSGFMAALALSVLMLPTVTRTCEVVLRLVPDGLREASLALGAPEWRTAMRVVLPTARAGVVTAIILGIARVIGETAPLIMTSLGSQVVNVNPFSGPQSSLPIFVYSGISSPEPSQIARAWTGAFVLIVLVLILFVSARIVGSRGVGSSGGRRRRSKSRTQRSQKEPA